MQTHLAFDVYVKLSFLSQQLGTLAQSFKFWCRLNVCRQAFWVTLLYTTRIANLSVDAYTLDGRGLGICHTLRVPIYLAVTKLRYKCKLELIQVQAICLVASI